MVIDKTSAFFKSEEIMFTHNWILTIFFRLSLSKVYSSSVFENIESKYINKSKTIISKTHILVDRIEIEYVRVQELSTENTPKCECEWACRLPKYMTHYYRAANFFDF